MKKFLLLSTLLIPGTFFLNPAKAQRSDNRIILELKDGKIYVNGDSVLLSGRPLAILKNLTRGAFLGVQTKDNDSGAEIVEVVPGSPAEEAGLQKGDIITQINTTAIKDAGTLSEVIGGMRSGEVVQITLLRNNEEKELSAILGTSRPFYGLNDTLPLFRYDPYTYRMPNPFFRDSVSPRAFLHRQPLPRNFMPPARKPELGVQIQETENDEGVTVLKVTPQSPADKAGVKEGDLITAINDRKVSNVADAKKETGNARGNEYKLQVRRNKKTISLTIKVPKKLRTADL